MLKIAVVGGKGGVKKTALSRALAVKATQRGFKTVGFDIDGEQASFLNWKGRRMQLTDVPMFPVVKANNMKELASQLRSANYEIAILDGAAYASRDTVDLVNLADLVVLPTTFSVDDMEPLVRIVDKLRDRGVPNDKIMIAFSGVLESKAAYREAVSYLTRHGCHLAEGFLPMAISYGNAQDIGLSVVEVKNAPRLFTLARLLIDSIIDRALVIKKED